MEIETKNASLDTLAVTILALHVSGKQMTQAVFKQLPDKMEDDDSELWGTVRYTIKDAGSLWLVFSSNGTLYRRALDPIPRRVSKEFVRQNENAVRSAMDSLSSVIQYQKIYQSNDYQDRIKEAEKNLEKEKELLEGEKDMYESDVLIEKQRFEYENKLSQLRQLFIAV